MRRILFAMLLAALTISPAAAGDEGHPAPPAVDDARFDFLKRLEGDWVVDAGQGEMSGNRFDFRLTSGGTAIHEREFIGTPMEMMTMYHMQGSDLVATHYCMLGNQPRALAAKRVQGGGLSFECDGKPGNAASHDDQHIHGWSMRLDEDGKLYYSAQMYTGGEPSDEAPSMVLVRPTQSASR
jgi:hypothetical protein